MRGEYLPLPRSRARCPPRWPAGPGTAADGGRCRPWLVLSVWYIVEVTSNDLASGADWGIAVAYLLAWTIVALPVGTFVLLSDRNSRYPFAPEEQSRFKKYTRLIHTAIHP